MIEKNRSKPGLQQPDDALTWLERALKMERLKYAAVPVEGDLVPQFVSASAWGYVTAAYTLIDRVSRRKSQRHALAACYGARSSRHISGSAYWRAALPCSKQWSELLPTASKAPSLHP